MITGTTRPKMTFKASVYCTMVVTVTVQVKSWFMTPTQCLTLTHAAVKCTPAAVAMKSQPATSGNFLGTKILHMIFF